ncbi:MAG TPA: SLC13 family permease [Candidatus Thermoplasmatota archaeon]|nr:SLC13 family permease [Candidatus Thermoplasmatota archaeon]
MLLSAGILVVTFALLLARRVARGTFVLRRPWIAAAGGLAMVLALQVSPQAALSAIDLPTLALLLGMMTVVAGLEIAGLFDRLSVEIVRRARNGRALLAGTMVASAVLSALVLNDAVVLVFAPILVKAARLLHVSCVPYLFALPIGANVGSVATLVGNPQNAYIGLASGVSFVDFAARLAPLAAAALALALLATLAFFRRELAAPFDRAAVDALAKPPLDPVLAPVVVAIAAATFAGFVASSFLPLPLHLVALAGGVAVALAGLLRGPRFPARIVGNVDYSILVLFAGLFVLVAGVRESGLLSAMEHALLGGEVIPLRLAAVTAVLSNLVSNVPAVVLLAEHVSASGAGSDAWLLLAAASTLAGNATLLGSAANLIVAETARGMGEEFDPWRFAKLGVPLSIATIALAVWWLS